MPERRGYGTHLDKLVGFLCGANKGSRDLRKTRGKGKQITMGNSVTWYTLFTKDEEEDIVNNKERGGILESFIVLAMKLAHSKRPLLQRYFCKCTLYEISKPFRKYINERRSAPINDDKLRSVELSLSLLMDLPCLGKEECQEIGAIDWVQMFLSDLKGGRLMNFLTASNQMLVIATVTVHGVVVIAEEKQGIMSIAPSRRYTVAQKARNSC